MEGFLRYEFGGVYIYRGLFSEFYVVFKGRNWILLTVSNHKGFLEQN